VALHRTAKEVAASIAKVNGVVDGQSELQSRAARIALDVRRGLQHLLDMLEQAIGLGERRTRRCRVIEHERAFIAATTSATPPYEKR
jgi:hypothetical protein